MASIVLNIIEWDTKFSCYLLAEWMTLNCVLSAYPIMCLIYISFGRKIYSNMWRETNADKPVL